MECGFCGSEFIPIMRTQKYCNIECQQKQNYIKAKINKSKRLKEKKIYQKQCLYCNKDFETTIYQQIYCTVECGQRFAYLKRKLENSDEMITEAESIAQVRAINGLPPIQSGDVVCLKCGITFFSEDILREHTCFSCRQRSSENIFDGCGGVKRNGHYYTPVRGT